MTKAASQINTRSMSFSPAEAQAPHFPRPQKLKIGVSRMPSLLWHQPDLEFASHGMGVFAKSGQRGCVLAGPFKTRDGAFGGAHAFSNIILRQARENTRFQKLRNDAVFVFKLVVGSSKSWIEIRSACVTCE